MSSLGQRIARFLVELFRVCLEGSLCGRLIPDEADGVTVNLRTNIKCCNKQTDVTSTENIAGDEEVKPRTIKPATADYQ